MSRSLILALNLLSLTSTLAAAQMPSTPPTQTQIWSSTDNLFRAPAGESEIVRPLGWQYSSVITANLSLTSSQDVVGQTSGTSESYGLNYRGSLFHFSHHDEWRNDLTVREATTKTASLGRFVKSDDELKLATIYLYYLPGHENVGPYARGEASAPVFKGEDAQGEDKIYRLDGTDQIFRAGTLRLTDGFMPVTTREAIGFFYRPYETAKLKIETRLGFAAQQIAADGQFARKGTDKNGDVIIQQLRDVSQAGLEAALSVKGAIDEKTGYEVGVDSLTPFFNDRRSNDSRSAWRLTNVDAFVKFNSKVVSWASFSYDYKLKLQPQLVDTAQQIHMVTLNLNYPVTPAKL